MEYEHCLRCAAGWNVRLLALLVCRTVPQHWGIHRQLELR